MRRTHLLSTVILKAEKWRGGNEIPEYKVVFRTISTSTALVKYEQRNLEFSKTDGCKTH